jgi:hypothetical protein
MQQALSKNMHPGAIRDESAAVAFMNPTAERARRLEITPLGS